MKPFTLITSLFLATVASTVAKPIVFDFEDPKKVNNVIFQMDAPLEAINGSAMGVSGKVSYDPAAPGKTKGAIHLAAATLHVGNPTMKEHIHAPDWMDVAKYPEIIFTLSKLTNLRKDGLHLLADAHGSMTIKGVTKPLVASVKLTYLKDMLIKRNRVPGDLLVIRSKFVVKRSAFGIRPGEKEEKVADEIEISLNVAGAAPDGK
jgi:polyisoprenoid-binding protein YceI